MNKVTAPVELNCKLPKMSKKIFCLNATEIDAANICTRQSDKSSHLGF